MSLKSWKAEFYPVSADKATESGLTAVRHSVLKWSGLSTEALEKHGIKVDAFSDLRSRNGGSFAIDTSTCACCESVTNTCSACPIALATGKECHEAFDFWDIRHNPAPMQELLKEALDYYEKKEQK